MPRNNQSMPRRRFGADAMEAALAAQQRGFRDPRLDSGLEASRIISEAGRDLNREEIEQRRRRRTQQIVPQQNIRRGRRRSSLLGVPRSETSRVSAEALAMPPPSARREGATAASRGMGRRRPHPLPPEERDAREAARIDPTNDPTVPLLKNIFSTGALAV